MQAQAHDPKGTEVFRYTVWTNLDSRFTRGYQRGDRLVRGYSGEVVHVATTGAASPVIAACDQVWIRHNRDDRPDGQSAPSLSVGDVITLDSHEVAYTVLAQGFEPVVLDPADLITEHSYLELLERGELR